MLNTIFKIKIKDLLKKDYAHNPEDGAFIANYIISKNLAQKDVKIDFNGILTANTAFCNVLYDLLSEKNFKITFINCNDLILETLKRVKENSKR